MPSPAAEFRKRRPALGRFSAGSPFSRSSPARNPLTVTAYDVPAGHRLALVIDTVDPLHIEDDPAGAQLTFSSPRSDPSYLSVPLREQ
ncbi:hypothetical protein [Streptomyces sp. NPDC089799]|uniref:hypothetical protein n=1 Tax=Streptomyces sp. NPDC089799 TaxID=3155066 RepID=UPI00341A09CB